MKEKYIMKSSFNLLNKNKTVFYLFWTLNLLSNYFLSSIYGHLLGNFKTPLKSVYLSKQRIALGAC